MTLKHSERMHRFHEAGLYLVTSEEVSGGRSTLEILRKALDAGVTLFQLREKNMPLQALLALAEKARRLTDSYKALLLINDRIDVALAIHADGVHLGQDDFPVEAARRLAPELIIGASSHSREEAIAAEKAGASYVNIGPIYPTGTKKWTADFLGPKSVKAISSCISIPFTVMGGIKREHISELLAVGARTMAVVTAVTMAPDPEAAACQLLQDIRSGLAARTTS